MKRRNLLKILPATLLPLSWGGGAGVAAKDPPILAKGSNPQPAPPECGFPVQSGPPKPGRADTWIVGESVNQCLRAGDEHFSWALVGVFDSEEEAIKACTNEYQFVGPAVLNVVLDSDGVHRSWPGMWYPMLEDNPRLAHYSTYVAPLDWIKTTRGNYRAFLDGYPKGKGERLLLGMEWAHLIELKNREIIILPRGQDILEEYEGRLAKMNHKHS